MSRARPDGCSFCSDELRDDDIGLKLNSIRRLGTIALALGEERSRSELVPYLAETKQDDDEVLVVLAEEIGKLVPYVGGPAHAHCLISLLEELAKTEETVVRDEAVKSMNKIGEDLSEQQMSETFIPALKVLPLNQLHTLLGLGLAACLMDNCTTGTEHNSGARRSSILTNMHPFQIPASCWSCQLVLSRDFCGQDLSRHLAAPAMRTPTTEPITPAMAATALLFKARCATRSSSV